MESTKSSQASSAGEKTSSFIEHWCINFILSWRTLLSRHSGRPKDPKRTCVESLMISTNKWRSTRADTIQLAANTCYMFALYKEAMRNRPRDAQSEYVHIANSCWVGVHCWISTLEDPQRTCVDSWVNMVEELEIISRRYIDTYYVYFSPCWAMQCSYGK